LFSKVDDSNSTAEMRTFTRVALSKLLCALGDELTLRITLLRGRALASTDPSALWEELAASFERS
jgi:hypothetical protein